MPNRYRRFRRAGGIFYAHDELTGKQESLRTRDKNHADQLIAAKNQAVQQPALNKAMAKVYLSVCDPRMATRTWKDVFETFASRGRESSQARSRRAAACKSFDSIRRKALVDTVAEDLLAVMSDGKPGTNHYMRRFHNLAVDLGWLLAPIIPKKAWPPAPAAEQRRGVTREEYESIINAEGNEERRAYYQLLWETGAAQTDAALLTAENIVWSEMVLVYERKKLRHGSEPCRMMIGPTLERLLQSLPQQGPLFPTIAKADARYRSAEFYRRCKLLKITGVSLHSFRYAWAERARVAGYPERFAQAALGHSSKAVHRAYARGAKVACPSLEDYVTNGGKVVPFRASVA